MTDGSDIRWFSRIEEKVLAGERLDKEEGLKLYAHADLLDLGRLADAVNRRKNGNKVYYIVNHHINHTNVCQNRCPLCAYFKRTGEDGAYTLSLEEVEKKIAGLGPQVREIHMVGGINPSLDLNYYLDVLSVIRRLRPDVTNQSLTAVEIDFIAEKSALSVQEVLLGLKKAGITALAGGGAEVFSERVRQLICPRKITGKRWLEIHETAHRLGIRTNATILHGHVETPSELIDHLIKLRELQDLTGGFLAFAPFPFYPQNTSLSSLVPHGPTGVDDLRMLAVSRLMLDNFDHIKSFRIMIGIKLAQVSLAFGVNDLDGTVEEEQIAHAAGAQNEESLTVKEIRRLIVAAGKEPVERDTLYNTFGGF